MSDLTRMTLCPNHSIAATSSIASYCVLMENQFEADSPQTAEYHSEAGGGKADRLESFTNLAA